MKKNKKNTESDATFVHCNSKFVMIQEEQILSTFLIEEKGLRKSSKKNKLKNVTHFLPIFTIWGYESQPITSYM